MEQTLVSCVMPTKDRRRFVAAAIDCWMKQTYRNMELVILDDGNEAIEDLIPDDERILYVIDSRHRCTGDKRNKVNELCRGEVICHFDDDDWSAPERVAFQVAALDKSGKPMTGFGNLLFWDTVSRKAKRFRSSTRGYVCGTTLCYLKEFWKMHRFKSQQEASDNALVYPNLRNICASDRSELMVARIHNCHHTSRKNGIKEQVPVEMIPPEFWENENLRLSA